MSWAQTILHLWHTVPTSHLFQLLSRGIRWTLIGLQLAVVPAVLSRRREPAVTMAWLLAIFFLPVVGILLFWLFGRGRVRRSARPRRQLLIERRAEEPPPELSRVPTALIPLARTAWEAGRAAVTDGNRVDVLIDAQQAFPAKLEAIEAARHTIDATYYLVRHDATGRKFRDALVAAAKRGVRVRLLLDALGSLGLGGFFGPLKKAGGHFRLFLPMNLLQGWSFNLRNHRKMLIVDNAISFMGGLNIGDEYLSGLRRLGHWRDTDLRIQGPASTQLSELFADDWTFATGSPTESFPPATALQGSGSAVQILPSGPDDRAEAIYNVFLAAISCAQRTLDLTTPYFVPDLAIWMAIRSAALRGVRVRMILPARNDQPLTALASASYGEELMDAGVQIYRYLPGMMHAKVMIVDGGWASVGTANMDVRSFQLNFEVNALLYGGAEVGVLKETFERDLAQSTLVDPKRFHDRRFWRRAAEGGARLLSPLL